MVEAAMHGSGNLVFVAPARMEQKIRKSAEAILTFRYQPPYCQQNKLIAPVIPWKLNTREKFPQGWSSGLR